MDQPRERDENGEKWEWRPLRLGDGREIRIFLGNGNDEDAYALENCNVVGVVLTMSLCTLARDTGCVIANVISVKGDYANLRKLCTGKNILSIVYLFDLLVSV